MRIFNHYEFIPQLTSCAYAGTTVVHESSLPNGRYGLATSRKWWKNRRSSPVNGRSDSCRVDVRLFRSWVDSAAGFSLLFEGYTQSISLVMQFAQDGLVSWHFALVQHVFSGNLAPYNWLPSLSELCS
jgi:hypothetical protein